MSDFGAVILMIVYTFGLVTLLLLLTVLNDWL
jgi:hypothetical protein